MIYGLIGVVDEYATLRMQAIGIVLVIHRKISNMPLPPQTLLANKYRIEAVIGQGAYGRVYRARDVQLDRLVAIKELHKGDGDLSLEKYQDYVKRFRREAQVQARFNHDHIVHVYELPEPEPDLLYLVMEFVEGGTLKKALDTKGKPPINVAVHLAYEILQGLAYVHEDPRDIVHRDIKPSNILLTKDGSAKISDFGLAQVGDESMRTMSGKPHPGSPLYMSPEQGASSDYLTAKSDLFSVVVCCLRYLQVFYINGPKAKNKL